MIRPWLPPILLLLALVPRCSERVPDPPRGELRVVVISDLNGAYGSTSYEPRVGAVVAAIGRTWRPDLVLAAGDVVAGQKPELPDSTVAAMWAAFDSVIGAPLREAGIPLAPTIGNHDGSRYPAHARDRRLAAEYWRQPRHRPALDPAGEDDFPFNYSFRLGSLFVLVWDASNEELARVPGLPARVEAALSSSAAASAEMRLVLGHLPLYAVAEGRNRRGEVLLAADSLRDLLERHRVRAYVSGHHHAYYPGRSGGLELLHAGALGQGPRPLIGSDAAPYPSVTILDIWPALDSIAYSTFRVDEGGKRLVPVPLQSLPSRVEGFNGTVLRRDVR